MSVAVLVKVWWPLRNVLPASSLNIESKNQMETTFGPSAKN
jgi:hypothetical protein